MEMFQLATACRFRPSTEYWGTFRQLLR